MALEAEQNFSRFITNGAEKGKHKSQENLQEANKMTEQQK